MSEKGINDAYFSYLALDATNEEFAEEVVSIVERDNNEWIIDKLDAELREHMKIMKELSADDQVGDKDRAKKDAEKISLKLGILRNLIDTYEDNKNLGNGLEEQPGIVKVVYAKNRSGNNMFQRSLADVAKYNDEKYEAVLALLERVYEGDTDFNSEKQRHLKSSDKLKGMYEMKDYQVRLLYMRESDYVVIIGAYVKKDDNDLRYRDTMENMKKQSEKYRLSIRNGKLDMEKELEEAEEYHQSLNPSEKRL